MSLHLRNIVREAALRGWMLHIVTTDYALGHPAYNLVKKEYGRHFTASTMPAVEFPCGTPSIRQLIRHQLQQFRQFAKTYQAIKNELLPDVIYVNDLNYCDKVMAILGSPFGGTPVTGMLMGVKFHHRSMGVIGSGGRKDWLYEKLFARLLRVRALTKVLVIDPLLVCYMEKKSREGYDKVRLVPDPAQLSGKITREQARRAFGIRDAQIVVLLYGALEGRKGIRELIAALRHLGASSNVVALVAGEPQDSATRQFLAEKHVTELIESGMLQVVADFLDDEREFAVFKAADIVWLGYQGFYGMSGVLKQAGLVGLPVIACKQGLIGWLVQEYGLGEILDTMDPAEIGRSIVRLANDAQARRTYGERGRELAMTHTPQHLAQEVCDAIWTAFMARRAAHTREGGAQNMPPHPGVG